MIEAIQTHNELAEPEQRTICRDLTIETKGAGPIVIRDFVRTGERIIGDRYASWLILAERSDVHAPYVVWTLIARPEGWALEMGNYYRELSVAELRFSHLIGARA